MLYLVDTSLTFLGPTIRVALLHNWDFLPWLLRQSDIVAGLIGSSSEKTMRSATVFLWPSLSVALLHNWDFLPWLLRQRYCCWTDWVFFWEDHAFSYKHGCLFLSTLSLFFNRLVIGEALVSLLVLHLLDNSSHFSWAIVCRSAPQLRFSILFTKTERYWCWTD